MSLEKTHRLVHGGPILAHLFRLHFEPAVGLSLSDFDLASQINDARTDDSRNAVLTLYPYFFGFEGYCSTIRFNPVRDTIYFDVRSFFKVNNGIEFDVFLHYLAPIEASSLRHIAINSSVGVDNETHSPKQYWTQLANCLERLNGLQSISTVHDVTGPLDAYIRSSEYESRLHHTKLSRHTERVKLLSEKYSSPIYTKPAFIELLEDFPVELYRQARIPEDYLDRSDAEYWVVSLHRNKWCNKKTRHVWGRWHVEENTA